MPPDRSALVLSPEAPYPMAGGGAMRTASILEYLGPRYALDVVVFREPGAPDPHSARVIDLPRHSKFPVARAARNLRRLVLGRPPLNDRFGGFGAELSRCIAGERYDVAIVEHFWCAPYVEQLRPHCARVILDLHNVESALLQSMADSNSWPMSAAYARFARAARKLEARWIPRFDSVLVASPQDAARIGGTTAHVYPNALPAVPELGPAEENLLIFSGNLEYEPNVSAVRFFRTRVWPLLRDQWPDLRWRLVGRNPHAVAQYVRGDQRIEIAGPVEDAVAELAKARVVVVPLKAASGTRFKILEAWAAGRAVVSTAIGAEGLQARDGEHLLIGDSPEKFAALVSALLADPQERTRLGAAGHALLEREFTWPRAWEALAKCGL